MRSEDRNSSESEEEEEAARMEICSKIYRTLLSPPLSCKHPTTVLVATYNSCTLHTYIRMVFASFSFLTIEGAFFITARLICCIVSSSQPPLPHSMHERSK